MTDGGKVSFLLVFLVLASALASAACASTEQARGQSVTTDPKTERERGAKERPQAAGATGNETDQAVARTGGAETGVDSGAAARAGKARASTGDARGRAGSTEIVVEGGEDATGSVREKDGPQKVTLRIKGDPGTRFSGACSVGRKERTLDGLTPKRYTFEPRGKRLECEVRKEGDGTLDTVFSDGEGARSVQRTNAGEGTVRFTYSRGSLSTSSVSVNQTVTSSGGSSSDGSP